MKIGQHHSLSEKCKSKPHWSTISCRSEWLLSKSLQLANDEERVQRKGNPLTLLVGMQISIATMENSVEIPLKTGNRTAIWPGNLTAGHVHWGNQNWNRHIHPSIHSSTIYNSWKQLRCPLADEWVRKLYIYTMEYYSAIKKKEWIWVSSSEMDETGIYYTEWCKSEI